MATGFIHHVGTFFLFLAVVFLVITCITAPVVHDLGILKVDLPGSAGSNGHTTVAFGTFGWCVNGNSGSDMCSPSQVGYSPAEVMRSVENTEFSDYAESSTRTLSRVMVLHPVGAGLNFIAFALALGSSFFGSLLASMISGLAFVVTVVVLICDFVMFSIIRSNVNDDSSGSYAYYSTGLWMILLSGICSLIGTVIVFLTCCSGRMHRRRDTARTDKYATDGYAPPATRRRRRWF